MFRAIHGLLLIAALLALSAMPALSQSVPDPANTVCDSRLGVSPKNNSPNLPDQYRYMFRVMLRDEHNDAVVGWPASQLRLNLSDTTSPGHPQYVAPDGPSAPMGLVVFRSHLDFGGSDPGSVTLEFDPTGAGTEWLPLYTTSSYPGDACGGVRSPDIDGDGVVGLSDLAAWQLAFIHQGPAYVGDIAYEHDCDVALADLAWWQMHFIN